MPEILCTICNQLISPVKCFGVYKGANCRWQKIFNSANFSFIKVHSCWNECTCAFFRWVQHDYYRQQHSCGKVMFLHLSGILSTGGCPPPSVDTPWADTPSGQTPPQTEPTRQTLTLGRHPSLGRHRTPPPKTATAVDGTHPTGMHSCC